MAQILSDIIRFARELCSSPACKEAAARRAMLRMIVLELVQTTLECFVPGATTCNVNQHCCGPFGHSTLTAEAPETPRTRAGCRYNVPRALDCRSLRMGSHSRHLAPRHAERCFLRVLDIRDRGTSSMFHARTSAGPCYGNRTPGPCRRRSDLTPRCAFFCNEV